MFILLFYSGIYYGGLYQNENSIVIGKYIFFCFISFVFFWSLIIKKKVPIFLIISAYVFLSLWTIINSPSPHVDTLVVLKEAPLKFLQGFNPYSAKFTKVYSNVEPNYYNYLPFSFVFMLPFIILFSDPRIAIIFSNLISVYIFNKIFNLKRSGAIYINLFILCFLFLPRSFYMLEHAYLDPVIFTFFLLYVYFLLKRKSSLSNFFLSLFFSFKQPPILTLPYFLNKKNSFLRSSFKKLIFFILPFMLPLYYLALDPKNFMEDVFFNLNPKKITSPINISLTLQTFLKSVLHVSSPVSVYAGIVLFVTSYLVIIKSKSSLAFKISATLFSFNFLMYHAFFNSYFLVALFLFADIAINYFAIEI